MLAQSYAESVGSAVRARGTRLSFDISKLRHETRREALQVLQKLQGGSFACVSAQKKARAAEVREKLYSSSIWQ